MNKLYLLIFICIFFACKKNVVEETQPNQPYICSDCFGLSKLKTKYNYNKGFKLYDDLNLNKLAVILNETDTNLNTYIEFSTPGFYELYLKFTDSLQNIKDTTYLFVIIDAARGETEWGLNTWIPKPFEENITDLTDIEIIYPKLIPQGITTPYILKLHEQNTLKKAYGKCKLNNIHFNIKYGVGSIQAPANELTHNITIANEQFNFTPEQTAINPIELPSTILQNTTLSSDSVYLIKYDLTITEGITLLLQKNTTLLIEEAVNIYNYGSLTIHGTNNKPVYITCASSGKFWGGIITNGNNTLIYAEHAIICGSGYHQGGEFSYGHAKRQALFKLDNSNMELINCYLLDHIGQITYPTKSTIELSNVIVQRVKTTGELSHSTGIINNCYFSDFPDDSDVFKDDDNDALYLSNSDATIKNSIFMYAKDDGLDTGSDEFGNIHIENCHFEACFHEGLAMASYEGQTKNHTIENCTFTNCQQGLEMGFSSSQHTATVNNCTFTNNFIGIRYGDNYDWGPKRGTLNIKNSQSLNNIHMDVWNMSRITWTPKIENMTFENTTVSKYSHQYPNLKLLK